MYTLRPLKQDEDDNYTVDVATLACESFKIILPIFKRAKHPLALFKDDVEIERNR